MLADRMLKEWSSLSRANAGAGGVDKTPLPSAEPFNLLRRILPEYDDPDTAGIAQRASTAAWLQPDT